MRRFLQPSFLGLYGVPRAALARAVFACAAPLLSSACGARAPAGLAGDDVAESPGGANGGTLSKPTDPGAGGDGQRPGDPLVFDTRPRQPCLPGTPRRGRDGAECPFMFRGACYETDDAACACACEDVAFGQCIVSGILSSDPLEVSCFEL